VQGVVLRGAENQGAAGTEYMKAGVEESVRALQIVEDLGAEHCLEGTVGKRERFKIGDDIGPGGCAAVRRTIEAEPFPAPVPEKFLVWFVVAPEVQEAAHETVLD
jgi:hypothetical protein